MIRRGRSGRLLWGLAQGGKGARRSLERKGTLGVIDLMNKVRTFISIVMHTAKPVK